MIYILFQSDIAIQEGNQHVSITEERIWSKAALHSPSIPIPISIPILIPIPIPILTHTLIIRAIETIDERGRIFLRKHTIQRLPIELIPIEADVHLSRVGLVTFVTEDATDSTDVLLEIGTKRLMVRDADDDVVGDPEGAVTFGFAGLFAEGDVVGVARSSENGRARDQGGRIEAGDGCGLC